MHNENLHTESDVWGHVEVFLHKRLLRPDAASSEASTYRQKQLGHYSRMICSLYLFAIYLRLQSKPDCQVCILFDRDGQ